MKEMIRMTVVITVLSAFSGGLLAAVLTGTKEQIALQQLLFVKGPAIQSVLSGVSNDPLKDNFKIKDGDTERDFYVGAFSGKANTVAFETKGKGFKDEVGMMVAVNIEDDKIVGVGVTTHKETPGLGSKAQTDAKFKAQFKGLPISGTLTVKADGGKVDAISGATITSRGVCLAINNAGEIYKRVKPQIAEGLKKFSK